MKVFLANRGNIDYYQDPYKKLFGTKSDFFVEVGSELEASAKCRQYIDKYDLGGGSFVGGQIFDDNNEMIAYVSYNGRVWNKDDKYFDQNKRMYERVRKGE